MPLLGSGTGTRLAARNRCTSSVSGPKNKAGMGCSTWAHRRASTREVCTDTTAELPTGTATDVRNEPCASRTTVK